MPKAAWTGERPQRRIKALLALVALTATVVMSAGGPRGNLVHDLVHHVAEDVVVALDGAYLPVAFWWYDILEDTVGHKAVSAIACERGVGISDQLERESEGREPNLINLIKDSGCFLSR